MTRYVVSTLSDAIAACELAERERRHKVAVVFRPSTPSDVLSILVLSAHADEPELAGAIA